MSYPYVFEMNNDIYMLPETSEVKKLIFYKCTNFPYKWGRHTEIDTEELFVDTDVINKMVQTISCLLYYAIIFLSLK